MGSKSGFPLGEVIQSALPSGHFDEILVPLTASPKPLHLRIARKLSAASGLIPQLESSTLPANAGSPWATDRHRYAANQALALLERYHDSLCLLPAAEDEFCSDFACAPSDVKCRIFVCFHQPPGWFRLNWRSFDDLKSLGGIVCLGHEQAAFFRSVCESPVHLLRHGVRHDFFQPPEDISMRKDNRLLFVGQWLRDFETLSNAMALVWSRRPDVQLDCVVPRFARNSEPLRRLAMDQRVTWHAELSDEQLRGLYQAADLLFLPLLDAVANNAVVEALACGLPIISTHVGGMSENLPSGAGQLCQLSDALSHAEAICNWLDDPARREVAGVTARNFAQENFDWGAIGSKLVDFLNKQMLSIKPDSSFARE
jgi:glycosyltransferase involved in cell wall biosynthesis